MFSGIMKLERKRSKPMNYYKLVTQSNDEITFQAVHAEMYLEENEFPYLLIDYKLNMGIGHGCELYEKSNHEWELLDSEDTLLDNRNHPYEPYDTLEEKYM